MRPFIESIFFLIEGISWSEISFQKLHKTSFVMENREFENSRNNFEKDLKVHFRCFAILNPTYLGLFREWEPWGGQNDPHPLKSSIMRLKCWNSYEIYAIILTFQNYTKNFFVTKIFDDVSIFGKKMANLGVTFKNL